MPLRAIIENKEIISSFLNDQEWEELKDKVKTNSLDVIIYQTQKKGYLRRSKNGLQHFVHKRGQLPEGWKPESAQHLFIKNEILLGCKDVGWESFPEFKENDWEADVLAINGKHRIAFEVQWSPQSYDKTIERQNKYIRDSVRCCWLFKKPPNEFIDYDDSIKANKDIPLFLLFENEAKEIKVKLYDKIFGVREFIKILLEGKIKFTRRIKSKPEQSITVNFFDITCWKCKARQYVYFLQETITSKCGLESDVHYPIDVYYHLWYSPEIIEAVRNFIKTPKGRHIRVGEIKKRFSKTVGKYYMSFGCYKCDALFGYNFINEDIGDILVYEPEIETKLIVNIKNSYSIGEYAHWCYKEDKNHCFK